MRQSLISSGLPKNTFNYKSGTPVGDVVEQLNARGFPMTTENELIEALRARAATGKVEPVTARQQAEGIALAGIREEQNTANLFQRLREIKDPNSPEGLAIMRRLNELGIKIEVPDVVHIDQVRRYAALRASGRNVRAWAALCQGSGYSSRTGGRQDPTQSKPGR